MKPLLNILLAVLLVCGTAYGVGSAGTIPNAVDRVEESIGSGISGRAVTATLFVSGIGNDTDGSSWTNAFTTIQGALDVASTNVNECTCLA